MTGTKPHKHNQHMIRVAQDLLYEEAIAALERKEYGEIVVTITVKGDILTRVGKNPKLFQSVPSG